MIAQSARRLSPNNSIQMIAGGATHKDKSMGNLNFAPYAGKTG